MNEKEKSLPKLEEEIQKLEEEIEKKGEEFGEEQDRLKIFFAQLGEEARNKSDEFSKEEDVKKKVKLWNEYNELIKKWSEVDDNFPDTAIKFYEIAKDDHEKILQKNREKVKKLRKRLKEFDGVKKKKKKAELRKVMMKVARREKEVAFYQKGIAHVKNSNKKKIKKNTMELMGMVKKVEEILESLVEKNGALRKEKIKEEGWKLFREIGEKHSEGEKVLEGLEQKFNERLELRNEENRKLENIRRMATILSYAEDDDEIYVDLFVELQEMSEATKESVKTLERTEKIQERTEELQRETAEIQDGMFGQLKQLTENTSTKQQFLTACISGFLSGALVLLISVLIKIFF